MIPWNAEDLSFDSSNFTNPVRLFPLPDLVMFPHVIQPLHIFEPRYRDLINAALDHDGLIAMSLLAPGRKDDTDPQPPILPHACLGKIVTHERTPEGHYNVLVLGLRRIRIESEISTDKSFREAQATILDDYYEVENSLERPSLQTALTLQFQKTLLNEYAENFQLGDLLSAEVPLGGLTDIVSFALPLDIELKYQLLAESDIDRRAILLLDALQPKPAATTEDEGPSPDSYSPPFSRN